MRPIESLPAATYPVDGSFSTVERAITDKTFLANYVIFHDNTIITLIFLNEAVCIVIHNKNRLARQHSASSPGNSMLRCV